jgi:hypothetical protein
VRGRSTATGGAAGQGAPHRAREYVGLGPRHPGMRAWVACRHPGTQACVGVVWAAMNGPIDEPLRPQMAFAFGVASIECMRVHAIRAARPPREFHCRESERLEGSAGRTSGPRLTLRCSVDDVLRVAHGM